MIKAMILFLFFGVLQVTAQDMQSCPMHKEHMQASQHQAEVEKRGDTGMGFPQSKTTHHFRLFSDGGAIEVTANDANDAADIRAIRSHLSHIASMFAEGDFSIPMFVHDQEPPGVKGMKEEGTTIHYGYQEIASGGRVRIRSTSDRAVNAVHEFLKFQIEDHHTGDSLEVKSADATVQ